jgi:hypothetical protein
MGSKSLTEKLLDRCVPADPCDECEAATGRGYDPARNRCQGCEYNPDNDIEHEGCINMTIPTSDQMHILLHSLGLDNRTDVPYRDYYATDPDDAALLAMVGKGWMSKGRHIPGGLCYFHVTDGGKSLAMAHHAARKPKLTPAQRRYRKWLDIADRYSCYTFKDFLTMPAFAEERKML